MQNSQNYFKKVLMEFLLIIFFYKIILISIVLVFLFNIKYFSSFKKINTNFYHFKSEMFLFYSCLQLEGNPFRTPRPAIIAKGSSAVIDYLRDRIVK